MRKFSISYSVRQNTTDYPINNAMLIGPIF